jgi:hypothetical protein
MQPISSVRRAVVVVMVTQAGKKQYFESANLTVSETNRNICIGNIVLVLQSDKLIITASVTGLQTQLPAHFTKR